MRRPATPDGWSALLAEIEVEISRVGYWSGEAKRLRAAAGARRLTEASRGFITAALADAGLESETAFRNESDPVMIGRTGAGDLARELEGLLPEIRRADREVMASATFRDATVARLALRTWRRRETHG